ncbi:MAG: fibronectin type III domain-containing protein, partial [Firmicutes bacterium]|nr:fibronectin type III domain-containing protein [Bacillota bacterium]
TVKWKKGKKAQVTGYQVTVATNKKFTKNVKTKKIKGYSKTSCKMTKLKAKKTYYVKVRAYRVTKTGTVYGPWSAVKNAKTK